jgi:hypothetical protein
MTMDCYEDVGTTLPEACARTIGERLVTARPSVDGVGRQPTHEQSQDEFGRSACDKGSSNQSLTIIIIAHVHEASVAEIA